jgi:hypothetical protein
MDHRQTAVDLYNGLWPLMDKQRSPEEDALLLHQAHASLWHWTQVGTPQNLARGEWMCSRVYAILGRAEPAMWHARRCLELAGPYGDWDLAIAHEAVARALVLAGQPEQAAAEIVAARAVPIAEDGDRDVVEKDLVDVEALLG